MLHVKYISIGIKDIFCIGKMTILQGKNSQWHISATLHCTLGSFALDTNTSLKDLILLISTLQNIDPSIVSFYGPFWNQKPYILKKFKMQLKKF